MSDSPNATEVANMLHELENQKKIINAKLTQLKLELGLKDLNDKIKDAKEVLYNAMYEEGLDDVGKYSIEKLLPADEKKAMKEEAKRDAYANALSTEIKNQTKLNFIVDTLTNLKI